MTILSFYQSDFPMSKSFWQKDRMVTHIFFDLCLFKHFSPVANFGDQSLGGSSDLEFYIGTTTIAPQTTTKKPVPTSCAFPEYATDLYCDDLNNTPECNYDGGACCGQGVDRLFCDACECLDPDGFEETDGCGGGASLGR